jgi:hypothetical protein
MVRARHPETVTALHPLETYEDVLEGVVQGVSHVEGTGDIRRRDDNRKGFFRGAHLSPKVPLLQPKAIPLLFYPLRIIDFLPLLGHDDSLSSSSTPFSTDRSPGALIGGPYP